MLLSAPARVQNKHASECQPVKSVRGRAHSRAGDQRNWNGNNHHHSTVLSWIEFQLANNSKYERDITCGVSYPMAANGRSLRFLFFLLSAPRSNSSSSSNRRRSSSGWRYLTTRIMAKFSHTTARRSLPLLPPMLTHYTGIIRLLSRSIYRCSLLTLHVVSSWE